MPYADFEYLTREWATQRSIIPNSSPSTQLLKAVSEMGELADATIKGDRHGIRDGVGDVMVCLIIFCALQKIDLTACLAEAYNEIKDRRGTMLPNGVFVKDLPEDIHAIHPA